MALDFQVNLFFLLNIVRVLITKLRVTHQAESSLYMRAVRATLILIPLLGIQFVLLPYKPQDPWVLEVYLYIMEILMHYQVRPPAPPLGRRSVVQNQAQRYVLFIGLTPVVVVVVGSCSVGPAEHFRVTLYENELNGRRANSAFPVSCVFRVSWSPPSSASSTGR